MIHFDMDLLGADRRFFGNEHISQINKQYVEDFLHSYNVSKNTLKCFYPKIGYVMVLTDDLKRSMQDSKELAKIFEKIHKDYSPSTFAGVLSVAKRFCSWLNEGELPKSFNGVMQLTKEEKLRLRKAASTSYETVEWQEGLKLISFTNDIQDKAFIITQLEAGMRPQEFLNLNYGDVKREGKFFILHVGKSKTAQERDVILYKSSPFLNRWYNSHPTQKSHEPLWLLKRGTGRYTQNAAKKLLLTLQEKSKIGKKLSMYMLRHSACRLAKLDNMNPEVASQQFGHSIKFYSEVYGKLSAKDKLEKMKKHYGEQSEEKEAEKDKPTVCPVCDTINEPGKTHCEKCNSPLTLAQALMEKDKIKKDFAKQVLDLIKENPAVLREALKIKVKGAQT